MLDMLVNDFPVVNARDFNWWTVDWGRKETNGGNIEVISCFDLVAINTGNIPTYERDGRTSIVDLTFTSNNFVCY